MNSTRFAIVIRSCTSCRKSLSLQWNFLGTCHTFQSMTALNDRIFCSLFINVHTTSRLIKRANQLNRLLAFPIVERDDIWLVKKLMEHSQLFDWVNNYRSTLFPDRPKFITAVTNPALDGKILKRKWMHKLVTNNWLMGRISVWTRFI